MGLRTLPWHVPCAFHRARVRWGGGGLTAGSQQDLGSLLTLVTECRPVTRGATCACCYKCALMQADRAHYLTASANPTLYAWAQYYATTRTPPPVMTGNATDVHPNDPCKVITRMQLFCLVAAQQVRCFERAGCAVSA